MTKHEVLGMLEAQLKEAEESLSEARAVAEVQRHAGRVNVLTEQRIKNAEKRLKLYRTAIAEQKRK